MNFFKAKTEVKINNSIDYRDPLVTPEYLALRLGLFMKVTT